MLNVCGFKSQMLKVTAMLYQQWPWRSEAGILYCVMCSLSLIVSVALFYEPQCVDLWGKDYPANPLDSVEQAFSLQEADL